VVRDPRQAIPLHGTWTGFPSDNLGMTRPLLLMRP
jgi:hypothetical protein